MLRHDESPQPPIGFASEYVGRTRLEDISEDEVTSAFADAAHDIPIGKDAHVLEGVPAFQHDVDLKHRRSEFLVTSTAVNVDSNFPTCTGQSRSVQSSRIPEASWPLKAMSGHSSHLQTRASDLRPIPTAKLRKLNPGRCLLNRRNWAPTGCGSEVTGVAGRRNKPPVGR